MKKNIQTLFILFTISAGNAIADTGISDSPPFSINLVSVASPCAGFADSLVFPLDLRFVKPGGTTNCTNSPLFYLNLSGINRGSSDSDSFSFDWLANSQPYQGPLRPLPYCPVGDHLQQYDSVNNRWIAPLTFPAVGESVVVLNFGWNSNANDNTFLDLASAISNRIPGIYIYTWDWSNFSDNPKGDANPNEKSIEQDFALLIECIGYATPRFLLCIFRDGPLKKELIKARDNAANEGVRLGNSLYAHGISPDWHKIHMIGSSYGGVVSAVAAQTLNSKSCARVQQVTTLDTPSIYIHAVKEYIKAESAQRVEVLYYDWLSNLLKGATGGPIKGNASNVLNLKLNSDFCPECSILNSPHILHFFVSYWYWQSIIDSNSSCENEQYGFGWSVTLDPNSWHWNDWILGNKEEYAESQGCLIQSSEQVKEDFFAASKEMDNFNSAASWITNSPQRAQLVVDGWNSSVKLTTGQGQQLQGGKYAFAKMDLLTDANVSYIYKEVNIPSEADQIALDVRFSEASEGDILTISIGNDILLIIDPCTAGISETYHTYYASVSDYEGQSAIIQIALSSSGIGQTVALIDNLRFTELTLVEDITGDKVVDEADLMVFADNWLIVGCNFRENCDGADIDRDNKVDFLDFSRLATYWLESL